MNSPAENGLRATSKFAAVELRDWFHRLTSLVPSTRWQSLGVGLSLFLIGLNLFAGAQAFGALQIALVVTLIGAAAVDAGLLLSYEKPSLRRYLPKSLALNQPARMELELANHDGREINLKLYDFLSDSVECSALPLHLHLAAGQRKKVQYDFTPTKRGLLEIPKTQLRLMSPWGFWQAGIELEQQAKAKVYPDFSSIADYNLLGVSNRSEQLGILKKQRRGEGTDFHQLREYVLGDSLRQINWKATSNQQKLISQQYHEEQDQRVVVMVDSGRRMLAEDQGLSHFDHSLNALMLLSYIALRQGDSFGVMSFGGADRWIPAAKGSGQTSSILNALYDLYADETASDYFSAVKQLLERQRKRALVVLITNVRDEESAELQQAVKLLRGRHVVLVANLREQVLDQTLRQPVDGLETALRYCGVSQYMGLRERAQKRLLASGVFSIDCSPDRLAATLTNSYLEIKGAGLL